METWNVIKVGIRYFEKIMLVKKRIHHKEVICYVTKPNLAKHYTNLKDMITDYNKIKKLENQNLDIELVKVEFHHEEQPIQLKKESK